MLRGGFLGSVVVKNPPANAGDAVLISGLGRSAGVEMATHSSILARKIPWTAEPGRRESDLTEQLGTHTHYERPQSSCSWETSPLSTLTVIPSL